MDSQATNGKLMIVPSIKTLIEEASDPTLDVDMAAMTMEDEVLVPDTAAMDVAEEDEAAAAPSNPLYPQAVNDTFIMNYAPFGTDPNHNPLYTVFEEDKPNLTNEIEYKLQEYIFSPATLTSVKAAPYTLRGEAAKAKYKELKFPRLENWHTDEMDGFLHIYFSQFVHEIDGVRFNITLALEDYISEDLINFIACRPPDTFAGHIQDKFVKTCKRREYRDTQFSKFLPLKLEKMISSAADMRPINLSLLMAPNLRTILYKHQLDNVNHMLNMIANPVTCHLHNMMVYEFGGYYHSADLKIITKDITVFKKRVLQGCILADDVGIGKTVQALAVWDVYQHANPATRCLVIVPDHLEHHWLTEINKHFGCEMMPNMLLISVTKFMDAVSILSEFQPTVIMIDEFHEIYKDRDTQQPKDAALEELNKKLEAALEAVSLYKAQFKIGITATPFPNDYTMHKILEFLLCETTASLNAPEREQLEYKQQVVSFQSGNEQYVRDQVRHVFIHKFKDTLTDIRIPNVTITDMKVAQLPEERAYYLAKIAEARYNIEHQRRPAVDILLKIACDAWLSISDCEDTTVQMNPATFREQTLATMQADFEKHYKYHALLHVQYERAKTTPAADLQYGPHFDYIATLKRRLDEARHSLESKRTVLERYKELIMEIDTIMAALKSAPKPADEEPDIQRPPMELVCQICYSEYTDEGIAYFKKCGHYFCVGCFRTMSAHTSQSKNCPMCRSNHSGEGDILVIGHINMGQIGSKMHAIRNIITTAKTADPTSKFIVYTQYDNYIRRLHRILSRFNLTIITIDEVMAGDVSAMEFDIILLSSKRNASGLDLSMVSNIIITDPFENYTFARAMERQVIGRAHRIGQSKEVIVHRLVTEGTIEETYYNM